jgi:hypothetical protein
MGRDSDREHKSWLLRPKPRTLGDAMQRGAGDGPGDGPGAGYDAGQDAGQADWQQLPVLPKWPPLREEDPFASERPTGETGEWAATGGYDSSEQQTAPPWDPSPSGAYAAPGRRARTGTVWQRFQGLSRRSRLGILVAAVSLIVLVCTLASVAALGGGLLASTGAARNTPVGQTGGQVGAPKAGSGTPTAAVSPTATGGTETPTAATLTLAFTCASGSIGGTGQVCVHTLPNASVSLSVRYCDGNDAKGSGLRGATRADGNGDYTWRWKVTTRCAGTATATVTAKSSGQTVTQSTTFTITR